MVRYCPRCTYRLTPLFNGEVELDHCQRCKGNFFDPGEVGEVFPGDFTTVYSFNDLNGRAADGTEQNTFVNSNPLGVHVPTVEFIDLDEMVGGDQVLIRVYYRLAQGGAWEMQDYAAYVGIDGGLANGLTIIAVDLYPNRFGVRVTLEQSAGAGFRTFLWKYFGEQAIV